MFIISYIEPLLLIAVVWLHGLKSKIEKNLKMRFRMRDTIPFIGALMLITNQATNDSESWRKLLMDPVGSLSNHISLRAPRLEGNTLHMSASRWFQHVIIYQKWLMCDLDSDFPLYMVNLGGVNFSERGFVSLEEFLFWCGLSCWPHRNDDFYNNCCFSDQPCS